MHVSSRGLALIEDFEGFSSSPYFDRLGGVWTRGFGETEGISAHSPSITRVQGTQRLRQLVETRYEWAIRGLGVEFTQNQWDALCSFVWNLGAGIFTGELRAALQRRDWSEAAHLMLRYDHAGGEVVAGLRTRREREMTLFLSDAPAPKPANPLDVLLMPERRLVNTYDAYIKHPRLHRHGLRVTRAAMVTYRKLIWLAAVRGSNGHGGHLQPGWDVHNRARRYELLLARTRGLG